MLYIVSMWAKYTHFTQHNATDAVSDTEKLRKHNSQIGNDNRTDRIL
jgi:hypothetical protein